MELKLVKIGNSKGVRIPKSMLVQTGMTERIEIEAQGRNIILKPVNDPRRRWEARFAKDGADLTEEDHAWLDTELAIAEDGGW
ncbi:MAG: AbrB/MazE/SpoVT family DNA-binding domain-containing protein [Sulfuricella sp.]